MYGPILDNSCDSGDTLAIGIFARFSWQLNPYIAGHCYYSDTYPNNPGTQTFVVILDRTEGIPICVRAFNNFSFLKMTIILNWDYLISC